MKIYLYLLIVFNLLFSSKIDFKSDKSLDLKEKEKKELTEEDRKFFEELMTESHSFININNHSKEELQHIFSKEIYLDLQGILPIAIESAIHAISDPSVVILAHQGPRNRF